MEHHTPRFRALFRPFFLIALAVGLVLLPCLTGPALAERHDGGRTLVFSTFSSEGMSELFSRILTEAYGRLGYLAEIRKFPAERALVMANQGHVDGEAARVNVVEKDYVNLIRVPTPIYLNRIAVLTKLTDFDPTKGWGQLSAYRLSIRRGYKFLESKTREYDCHLVSSYEQLLLLVENGRTDIGLAEYFDIMPTLGQVPLGGVRMLERPMAYNHMYHYLHKQHADLVPMIDAVLRQMTDEGRMVEIEHQMINEFFSKSLSSYPMMLNNF